VDGNDGGVYDSLDGRQVKVVKQNGQEVVEAFGG